MSIPFAKCEITLWKMIVQLAVLCGYGIRDVLQDGVFKEMRGVMGV